MGIDGDAVGATATYTVPDFLVGAMIDPQGLLVGESHAGMAPGNLAGYLQFDFSGGNTTISIDTDGLANGPRVDQVITLIGYNTGGTDSASILRYLLTSGDLFAN